MELQAARQIDYLQRTLSIFLSNSNDLSERFECLIDELIKENKQLNSNSPESSSSDSKSDVPMTNGNSPKAHQQKKRSATNSKPPPTKRLKSVGQTKDDDEEEKRNSSADETNDDDDDQDESKTKESQSRDINEFAIDLGLVCNKCMVLTEEKDNRLVECHECHLRYHQKCHKPLVSTADISDPRSLWYCAKCRRLITKRQQSQSTIKETKSNSNSSSSSSSTSSTTKPKNAESILSSVKKNFTDVTTGFFTLKAKSSDSLSSDNNTSHSTSQLNSSNSSTNNGTTTKNVNGWASLVTGSKEKKVAESSTSILNDSNSGTTTTTTPTTPSSPKSSFNKNSFNGSNLSLLKTTSSTVLSTIKPSKPSSPPVVKTQLSTSTTKSTTKVLPTGKSVQRISSPTPLGRQSSTIKSPPPPPPPPAPPARSSTTNSNHLKIPSGLDCEKRLKKIRKLAAEKTLTKKY